MKHYNEDVEKAFIFYDKLLKGIAYFALALGAGFIIYTIFTYWI